MVHISQISTMRLAISEKLQSPLNENFKALFIIIRYVTESAVIILFSQPHCQKFHVLSSRICIKFQPSMEHCNERYLRYDGCSKFFVSGLKGIGLYALSSASHLHSKGRHNVSSQPAIVNK